MAVPGPFLKWAGGKRALEQRILDRLPRHIETYVEPFVGGGAVFFALARERRFERAILGDRNLDLVEVWRAVRDEPEVLIRLAGQWPYDERVYYEVRALDPATLSPVERAARLVWLNRTGYNGLYRVNRSGQFNVPFGRHANPRLVNEENIRACSEVLQGVDILVGDFEEILDEAPCGSTVYCDPPYWPVKKTSFIAYDPFAFGPEDHERLRDVFRSLPERGMYGVLSNSDTPETRALYAGLPREFVQVRRLINRDGNGRGPVSELLVRTHRDPRAAFADRRAAAVT